MAKNSKEYREQAEKEEEEKKKNNWTVEEDEAEAKEAPKKKKLCSLTGFIRDVDVFCYKMDQCSFFIFALAFIIFNIVFAVVYG